jgi:hypothetical protein
MRKSSASTGGGNSPTPGFEWMDSGQADPRAVLRGLRGK